MSIFQRCPLPTQRETVASTCKISSSGRGSTPAVCQVRHSTGRSCTCTSTCRDREREESLSAIRIPFNFYCCPNSTSSVDLTASSACFTIIKKSSCPENWQGDHPSGLRLPVHYAYALTPKMEREHHHHQPPGTLIYIPCHFPLEQHPPLSPPPRSEIIYSITRPEDFHCRHHHHQHQHQYDEQASKLVRNST